jgi:hypothetical protein
MPRRRKLTDELRAAIDASGRSRYSICQEIGLDFAVMSRFMSHKRGLSLDTVDKLARVLDLHITLSKRRRKGKP